MEDGRSAAIQALQKAGYARLSAAEAGVVLGLDLGGLSRLTDSWERLPRDTHLRDAGAYRARRHGSFVQVLGAPLRAVPHRPHWQPAVYNALHGGLTRWFEAIEPEVATDPGWVRLIESLGVLFAAVRGVPRWFIEAHQFRIDTASGIGRPTPEGAHRDGVDFVALILVGRRHVVGGETRVFEAAGVTGVRFTLAEPWSMLLMDDARVIHETTPLQPEGAGGSRDTLVLTYRAQGFQDPANPG